MLSAEHRSLYCRRRTERAARGGEEAVLAGSDRPRRRWFSWRRVLGLLWPDHPTRWSDVLPRLRPHLVQVFRLTAAAVLTFLITSRLTNGLIDLTGPLTALLVIQASAFSTLKMGAVRVGAVLGGVLVATLLSTWVGLTWWSLGAAIAASLLLGKLLRLGEQLLETPISAMLILGVTNHDVAAETRVLNTLIGAGVGIAFNLVYPPAMPTRSASRAVVEVSESVAAPLDAAGDAFEAGPVQHGQVEDWLGQARAADTRVERARAAVAALKDSRRFNPRALGTTDVEPVLASGLRTQEACLLAVRALLAALRSELPTDDAQPEDPLGEELRTAFAVVLHDVADSLRGFGNLVVAEAEGREEESERALDTNLEVLRETQAILTELIMVDARENPASWLLRGSILAAVEHVLDQLDLEDRARTRIAWKQEQAMKPMAHLPMIVQAALPHPERPFPRGLPPGTVSLWPPAKRRPDDPSGEPDDDLE